MYLTQLKLVNFKNYPSLEVNFDPNINCLIGYNGVGKTNVLDAIYYLSFCKSCFNLSDSQNILHNNDFFAIHGKYVIENTNREEQVSCVYKAKSGKDISHNKKKYNRYSEHIGKIPLVIISPYDQELINSGSEIRRKFLDGIISQIDKNYLENLIHYQKVLEQRNKLLKDFSENRYFDESSMQIWDEQLVRFGTPLYEKRVEFLKEFSILFENFYNHVSTTNDENVAIEYCSHLNEQDFQEQLIANRTKDLRLQYTSIGIHKDDLIFNINGYPIKRIGSQGQQKSFSLSLKLANFQYIKHSTKITPILLLDDIFDKLDAERVKHIISLVNSDQFGQVFLTDTQHERVKKLFKKMEIQYKVFNVENNQLVLS